MAQLGRFRRITLQAAILALPVLLGGCPPARVAQPAATPFAEHGSVLQHVASGMQFMDFISGFHRADTHTYSAAGDDVSVGYNFQAAGTDIVGTVYVYPSPSLVSFGSPANVVAEARATLLRGEFERRKHEIETIEPEAALLSEEPFVLQPDGKAISGLHARYTFKQVFAGVDQKLQSDLYVFCNVNGHWALEYRFSYPVGTDAAPAIASFMQALALPAP